MFYCANCTSPFEDNDYPLRNAGALLDSSDLEADKGTKPHLSLPIVPSTVTVAENKAVVTMNEGRVSRVQMVRQK